MTEKSPAFRFYPRDFLTSEKQSDMSLQQAGAYIRLMCHAWLNGSLPDDIRKIAHKAGTTETQMRKLWPDLSQCFELEDDGRWYHPRLEKERQRQQRFSERQRSNGGRGGRPKTKPDKTHGFPDSEPKLKPDESQTKAFLANANANANASVLREGGAGETFRFDKAFLLLKQLYPEQRVTSGRLTEDAFLDVLSKAPEGPEQAFRRMLSNLENQKRGHEWRIKKMIPKLENWLRSGAWEQQHDEAPGVAEQVSPRTLRILEGR